MNPNETPFPPGWLSFDLGHYRPCDGTYCFYDYDSLPPLDTSLFRGEFQWLPRLNEKLQETMEIYKPPQEVRDRMETRLKSLMASAKPLGLQLPDAFVRFMRSFDLQGQIPSCTACYFDLSDRLIKSLAGDEGYLIRFLNDQQGVLLWYLYLKPGGEHCVLVSAVPFDDESIGELTAEAIIRNTCTCAPTFEEFLYRFWLENTIWFALSDGDALTDGQQVYLSHYK